MDDGSSVTPKISSILRSLSQAGQVAETLVASRYCHWLLARLYSRYYHWLLARLHYTEQCTVV